MNENLIYKSPYDDTDYEKLLVNLNNHFKLDLSGYKQHRVRRRIDMLMRKHSQKNYSDYFLLLKGDPSLWDEFLDKLTINVTEFFRNPEKWDYLENTILPMLKKNGSSSLNLWSAGCSTGEEPYTLSIVLEKMKDHSSKILAADLDKFVLEKAKKGIYESRSLVNISEENRKKYFDLLPDNTYQVKFNLKNKINFKQLNLLTDSFDKNFDFIICRNVVIYFDTDAKDKLYRKFSEALKPGGILFVGSTERIFNYKQIGLENYSPFFYQKV